MSYVPLDHWMICDRCGASYRYSEMREEWTGLWVCARGCWEPRHPQDSVTGVLDLQTVPVSRPDVPQTMGTTTLNGAVSQWATSVTLTSITGVEDLDGIGIEMDNGLIHWSFVNGDPVVATLVLGSPIPYAAANGNTVYLPSINSETYA